MGMISYKKRDVVRCSHYSSTTRHRSTTRSSTSYLRHFETSALQIQTLAKKRDSEVNMAAARNQGESMPLLVPNFFPGGPFYITYRRCFCKKEMILVPVPLYPAPSPWPACYYPPPSCLVKSDACQCRGFCLHKDIRSLELEPMFTAELNPAWPEYPSYSEDQLASISDSNESSRRRRHRRNAKREKTEIIDDLYGSWEDLDR
ncbi:uncharacterized protein [Fopius arisanus]|uniref:Uncharacterized protein n=1 Tax=Fopius arisanus TaxID=64838 RepID=A0A9R1TWW5_9HYME|nr:PREDICTED: uncharacterized protein LOC105264267 [Fopius arisanus]